MSADDEALLVLEEVAQARSRDQRLRMSIDLVCAAGRNLAISGWIDDRDSTVAGVTVEARGAMAALGEADLRRTARADVDADVNAAPGSRLGFIAFTGNLAFAMPPNEVVRVVIALGDGRSASAVARVRSASPAEVRLEALAGLFGCSPTEARRRVGSIDAVAAARDFDALETLTGPQAPASPDFADDGLVVMDWQAPRATAVPLNVDAVVVSPEGGIFVVGWIDDRETKLVGIRLVAPAWQVSFGAPRLARVRRRDVEQALGIATASRFGFWGLHFNSKHLAVSAQAGCTIEFVFADGSLQSLKLPHLRQVEQSELRNIVLGQLVGDEHIGSVQVEASNLLDSGIGDGIVALNHAVVKRAISGPHVIRFGKRTDFRMSVVVCLYGRAEFLMLQAAAYSATDSAGIEFVYVSNSPELAETLIKEARIATLLYDVSITLVILSGNAGFGAANNVAVDYCRSRVVCIMNPDVFPRSGDWAARLIEGAASATGGAFFGTPLHYDDGSLMHGGMYLETDTGISFSGDVISERRLLRVEHYDKGTPAEAVTRIVSKAVPAVTGALMVLRRPWYERLAGFSPDFVFGHYEDADLCLRSFAEGEPVFLRNIAFWHLEGRGSTRLPVHEGGSLVNRWLFTRKWLEYVDEHGLLGPAPPNPAFMAARAAAA
ncbi:MAG: glycosyltransferase family 2 protein [Bauldia sp.]|nr:glycosyltransferase family 2 protein [Bauldia sp.]